MDSLKLKQMIQEGFDTVAPGYDHPSLAFFPEAAQRMLAHLRPDPDGCLLDVCTGTGVVALAAAGQMPEGRVTGIDLSSGMLEQARNKARQRGLGNVEFVHVDLEQADFPARHFDLITIGFGLFFMSDMSAALSRMLHMLKPGGRIAVSSFTDKAFDPMSDLFLRRYESFGYEVPPLSWKRLSTPQAMRDRFGEAGIEDVSLHNEPLGYYMETAQSWWDIVWNAGFRRLLNELSGDERRLFEQQHREEISALCRHQPAWLDTGVIIAIGRKP